MVCIYFWYAQNDLLPYASIADDSKPNAGAALKCVEVEIKGQTLVVAPVYSELHQVPTVQQLPKF